MSSSNWTIIGLLLFCVFGQCAHGQNPDQLLNRRMLDFVVRSDADLVALYPEEGGNMFLSSLEGSSFRKGIIFEAEPGILEQGESAAPFAFFIPNATSPGNVTLGILGTPVTIDRLVKLDVFVAPNTPDGSIISPQPHFPYIPVFMVPSLETVTCIIPADELVGDLDDNGTVEFSDFLTLAGNFGSEVDTYGEGDINCNGTVDFEDFIRLGGNFGESRTAASQPVPEPNALGLSILGFFAFGTNRQRRSS